MTRRIACAVLFSVLFVTPGFSAPPHVVVGKTTSADIKTGKASELETQIARSEIRIQELNLELAKLKKLREGERSESRINDDLTRENSYLESKRRETELLGKLTYDSCYAEWEVIERQVAVNDPDSGFRTGSSTENYLRCNVLVDICNNGQRPYGIAQSHGHGLSEIYIRDKNDSRAGKECKCMCMSNSFANDFFR